MFANKSEYYLDIDEIFSYCAIKKEKGDDYRQKEISDNYELDDEDKLRLSQKLVHEVITPNDYGIDDTKYDLIKMIVSVVLSSNTDLITDKSPISQKVAFNTLLNKKFIKTK